MSACLLEVFEQACAGIQAVVEAVQRSLKNTWPDISPASSAPVSFIFALMKLWPVFHNSGRPRARGSS